MAIPYQELLEEEFKKIKGTYEKDYPGHFLIIATDSKASHYFTSVLPPEKLSKSGKTETDLEHKLKNHYPGRFIIRKLPILKSPINPELRVRIDQALNSRP